MSLGRVKRALCALALVLATLTSCVYAADDAQPIVGLFDMAKLFLASRTDGDVAPPPTLSSFNFFGGYFTDFMDSAKLLAAGQPESMTTANIDAILREIQSNNASGDVGLVFQGVNATDFDRAYEMFFNDTNTESAELRRHAFSQVFGGILNVTASAMSGVDDQLLASAMADALQDASSAANLVLSARTDEDRRAAAIALYDRVNGMLSEGRRVLRGAMHDGPNADHANRLLAAAIGASSLHFFDDATSRFYIHSSTARHPDGQQDADRDVMSEGDTNASESIVAPIIGSVVGFAVIAAAVGVAFARVRTSQQGASSARIDGKETRINDKSELHVQVAGDDAAHMV